MGKNITNNQGVGMVLFLVKMGVSCTAEELVKVGGDLVYLITIHLSICKAQ